MSTAVESENRFESDARRYADYLETPEGRLRADLTFANVREFLPARVEMKAASVLDVGCGPGTTAVRLASLGMDVTLFDSSPAMLDLARKTVAGAGGPGKANFKCGDVAQLADSFSTNSFDLILCHNVLEYVDAPHDVLHNVLRLMRDRSAILSVLVRNQAGEVLKAAIAKGDLIAAEQNLTAERGRESLYGGEIRLFTPDGFQAMLESASFKIVARRGVRVVSDYLPVELSRSTEYERILSLEQKLGRRKEFFGIARYLHCLAAPALLAAEADK